ncbi:DUF1932 domain-containing protein [Shimia sp. W99]
MPPNPPKLAFIGFGEAAQAFTRGLRQETATLAISAFDIKTEGSEAAAKRADYTAANVQGAESSATATVGAELIFSLVTADQAEAAAKAAARSDLDGALYLDGNSCAPDAKRRAAQIITEAGGRYVDLAIMTPVQPHLHKSPCLLAGPDAQIAQDITRALGMETKLAGQDIGAASTRKMVRSIMIKGLEALTLECFLAARKAGVEDHILASLETSFPGFDWATRAPYMIERSLTHGIRRAAEMREVAQTVTDLGLDPLMATATAARQQQMGDLNLHATTIGTDNLAALTDAILTALAAEQP